MASGDHKALIRRYIEELNRRNFDILDEVVADEVQFDHGLTVSRKEYRKSIADKIAAYPDYHVKIEQIVPEGEQVAICWRYRGTPPADSGAGARSISCTAISTYRIVDSRIVAVVGVSEVDG